jgi:hypothetical protein
MIVARTNKTEVPDTAAPDLKVASMAFRSGAAHYTDLVQAPLSDKFAELLARLEVGEQVPEPRRRDAFS